jgi:outer membrane lipoprotein SlyB
MGPVGAIIGKNLGEMTGSYFGKKIGNDYKNNLSNIGGAIGGLAGASLLSFQNGGKIPGKKGKPIIIEAHSGEYILPINIPPNKQQKSLIEKRKRKKREDKVELFI